MGLLVDLSDQWTFHYNYCKDAANTYYNHYLNQPLPVDAPTLYMHYCRYTETPMLKRAADVFVHNNNVSDGESILLVGEGFGWMAEEVQALRPNSQIVCTDISPWVHSVKDQMDTDYIIEWLDNPSPYGPPHPWRRTSAQMTAAERDEWIDRLSAPWSRVEIIDEDLLSSSSANRVRQRAAGGRFDHAFSHNILPWMTDDSVVELSRNMVSIARNASHHTAEFDPDTKPSEVNTEWNWKYRKKQPEDRNVRPQIRNQPWFTTESWEDLAPFIRFDNGHRREPQSTEVALRSPRGRS